MSTQPLAAPVSQLPLQTSTDRPAAARCSLNTLRLAVTAGLGFGLLAIVVIWAVAQVGLATHLISPQQTTDTSFLSPIDETSSLPRTLVTNIWMVALLCGAVWASTLTPAPARRRYGVVRSTLSLVGVRVRPPRSSRLARGHLVFVVVLVVSVALLGFHVVQFGLFVGGLSNSTHLTPWEVLSRLPHAVFEWPAFAMPLGLLVVCARSERRSELRRCLPLVLCIATALVCAGAGVERYVTPNYLSSAVQANLDSFRADTLGHHRVHPAIVVAPAVPQPTTEGR
jgi:hypothetical protein